MGLRSDIRVAAAIKEVNGSTGAIGNLYTRAIFHSGHNEFVICGDAGVIYTLDGISNKVQQAPGITAAALPFLVEIIQDYRDGIQTIVGDGTFIAIDDGSLDNWIVGGRGQLHNGIFTLAGDSNLYFIFERVVISNDNFVSNLVNGVTIFTFPGIQVIAQTLDGTRIVVAHALEVGFINAGNDPNVVANWNVIANVGTTDQITQIAINNAGTLAIMGTIRGDLISWRVGVSAPVLYSAANNPFINVNVQAGNQNISSVTYSSFWGGFIIYNASGSQVGFIDEANPVEVQSALFLGFNAVNCQSNPRRSSISAANPVGEIIICTDQAANPHELLLVSPP